jgi:hypothetical protein
MKITHVRKLRINLRDYCVFEPFLPTYLPTYLPAFLPIYSSCSHLEHMASVKHFVSLQFFILRESAGLHGQEISPTQGRYLHKHRLILNIHALNWIRAHDPSVRTGEDISCFRLRGCPMCGILKNKTLGNITFFKLNLFPSSGEGVARYLLCCTY